jgi:hypothetical protein
LNHDGHRDRSEHADADAAGNCLTRDTLIRRWDR